MDNQIKVSVISLAYNHEKYIRSALEGFIMQKTNFKFEVLINDDASTDDTADIIREYAEKYPDIIKPIYQTENQHSKGVKISSEILAPIAKGKYLAWCECDDYWTDPFKLQKQYDFLSNNPEYSICMHKVMVHDIKCENEYFLPNIDHDCDLDTEDLILRDGICATNSIMMKKEAFASLPSELRVKGVGDYQIKFYGSIHGKCRYLSQMMSVYNRQTEGSWTVNVYNVPKKSITTKRNIIDMLDRADKYFDYRYHDAIVKKQYELQFTIFLIENNKRELFSSRYFKRYCKHIISCIKGKVVNILRYIGAKQ